MYSHPQHGQGPDEVLALRQQAGKWLRSLREEAKLSQRDLANAVGLEYYTFVSQIEAGRGRVPPAQYEAFAKALGLPARDFVHGLLRFYDPITFNILFGADAAAPPAPAAAQDELAARVTRLEALLGGGRK